MENKEIKIVRLKSGEDVIATFTENKKEKKVTLESPMHIIFKRSPTLESNRPMMYMYPWVPVEMVEKDIAFIDIHKHMYAHTRYACIKIANWEETAVWRTPARVHWSCQQERRNPLRDAAVPRMRAAAASLGKVGRRRPGEPLAGQAPHLRNGPAAGPTRGRRGAAARTNNPTITRTTTRHRHWLRSGGQLFPAG